MQANDRSEEFISLFVRPDHLGRGDARIAHHFDIPELYFSYVAPLGKGLRFDVGKFATPLGYEVIGGYDGYNDNFSRGFVFGYGVPLTHTGVKASYAFNSKISSALLVTNGCDAVTCGTNVSRRLRPNSCLRSRT